MRTATTLAHPYILHANRHTSWGVTAIMHAAYLIYSCQYKSHEFNWHSYRKTGKSLSIIIEKVPCMQWWEREPSDERGWACFYYAYDPWSILSKERERGGGVEGEGERESGGGQCMYK